MVRRTNVERQVIIQNETAHIYALAAQHNIGDIIAIAMDKRQYQSVRTEALFVLQNRCGNLENIEGLRINRFVRSFLTRQKRRAEIARLVESQQYPPKKAEREKPKQRVPNFSGMGRTGRAYAIPG